jgi:hypothetical protein
MVRIGQVVVLSCFFHQFQTTLVEKSAASCNLPHFVFEYSSSIENGSGGKSAASWNLPHFVYDFWFSIPNGIGGKKCGKLQLAALCVRFLLFYLGKMAFCFTIATKFAKNLNYIFIFLLGSKKRLPLRDFLRYCYPQHVDIQCDFLI